MTPLRLRARGVTMSSVTSPATLKVSLPRPPIEARRHAERRAEDEELVVALQAIDLDHLDVVVADVDAGAEDAVLGDDDVVGELGAEDDDLVEARRRRRSRPAR